MSEIDEIILTETDIREIKKSLLLESFYDFVKYFWHVIISEPFTDNWHIEYLCDELQIVAEWVIRGEEKKYDLIINIAPGTTKSTLISRMLNPFIWANDPSKTIIVNNIDSNNSNEFATTSRDIITSDEYQELFPHVQIRKDVSAKTFYQTTKGGRRYSVTTKGKSKIGKHADLLIDDDPMDFMTAQSEEETKSSIEGFKALQTRKKNKAKTPYILVMQRLSYNDTTAHALKVLPKIKHICLPAENKHNNVIPPELNEKYIDGLLDPVRLSREILKAEKKGLNSSDSPLPEADYEIQYNQLEINEKGLLYTLKYFKPSKLLIAENEKIKISSLDSANDGSDSLSCPYGFLWNDKFYVEGAIFNKDGIKVNKIKLENKLNTFNSLINIIETNGMGGIVYSLLNVLNKLGVNRTRNKLTEIKAYAWIISEYFVFNEENTDPEFLAFLAELMKFPKDGKAKHDDAADSLTLIAMYLFINHRYLFQNAA